MVVETWWPASWSAFDLRGVRCTPARTSSVLTSLRWPPTSRGRAAPDVAGGSPAAGPGATVEPWPSRSPGTPHAARRTPPRGWWSTETGSWSQTRGNGALAHGAHAARGRRRARRDARRGRRRKRDLPGLPSRANAGARRRRDERRRRQRGRAPSRDPTRSASRFGSGSTLPGPTRSVPAARRTLSSARVEPAISSGYRT